METRKIGTLDVSVIGLGTNNFGSRLDEGQTGDVLDAAIDNGINFIDTADMYGGSNSETYIGNLLGARREKVVLATKFGMSLGGQPAGGSPAYLRSAVEESLRRLQTDFIDLYIYHRPDPEVPIVETLGAMGELVDEGKVRELGCSNFSAEQLKEAEANGQDGRPRFVNVQNSYSLLQRSPEEGVLAECVRQGIGFVPYSPLVGGLLSGKYRKGAPMPEGTRIALQPEERRQATLSDANLEAVAKLTTYAEAQGHTMLDLAMSWLLAQPAVSSVIAGASNLEQVRANVASAHWTMSTADLSAIDQILS
jgi:aryl-alcohol dehydrogenase-like predicted oxidoreductase